MTQEEANKMILDNCSKEGLAQGWFFEFEKRKQLEQEIDRLNNIINELENIRKEAIEYIEKDKLNIDDSQCYVETQTGWKMIPEIYDNLLNILNKGSESNE